jgi:hypothetical protein
MEELVMIDYVKIIVRTIDVLDFLNKLGDPIQKMNRNTGELLPIFEVKHYNLTFTGYETGIIIIKGSLHKYYNKGRHNHDDFPFTKLCKTIHNIFDRFGLPLENFRLQNIEFGVNIFPNFSADEVVNGLVMHKSRMFKDISLKSGNYRQVEYKQYFVKAYSKCIQYNLKYPVFRFEIKVRTMQNIRRFGFITVADLLDKDKLRHIRDYLVDHWDKVLLIDPTIKTDKLNSKEKSKYKEWSNPNFWRKLDSKKNKLSNQKKAFNLFVNAHSKNIHQEIKSCIQKKWNELLSS